MSETKHTPGPWAVEDPLYFELTIVEANKPTHEWRFIASLPLPETGELARADDIPLKEIEANARLIAAAPELLDFVRRIAGCNIPVLAAEAARLMEKAEGRTDG